MQRKIFLLLSLLWVYSHSSAQSQLSVESIMRHPSWMGTFPSRHYWSANSQQIYFNYNPEKNQADSLYKIDAVAGAEAIRVPWSEEKILKKKVFLSADKN